MLQGNYMSQTIAICIYDPGETLSVVCLYLRQFAFPITPLLPLPCKCNSCSRPVGDVSDIQRLAQGEAQLTGRIQGSQTRLLPTRFVTRDPKKSALQGPSTRNREPRCLSPLTRFVSRIGVGAFGGWVSCRDVVCVEGYYEQVWI